MAQVRPRLGDVSANLEMIESVVRRSNESDPDLVVFPELSLTGYRLRDLVPHVALRLDQSSEWRDRLLELSTKQPFVVGLVEETVDHRFFNSAIHVDGGEIVHVHRKCYLPTYGMFDEAMDFSPGDALASYGAFQSRIGILICEDAWHPAAATVLAQDGAAVLLVLSAAPLRGLGAGSGLVSLDSWRDLVTTVARFHTAAAIWVNRIGFEDGLAFGGRSFAVGPTGHLIAEAEGMNEEFVTAEIDLVEIRAARAAFPLVRDERADLLAREFAKFPRASTLETAATSSTEKER